MTMRNPLELLRRRRRDGTDAPIEDRLRAERPRTRGAFTAKLRLHLAAQAAGPDEPRRLRLIAFALVASGVVSIVIAAAIAAS